MPKTLAGAANLNQAHGDFGAVPFGLIKVLREYGTPLALASPGALPPGSMAGSSLGSSITTQGSHRETGLVRWALPKGLPVGQFPDGADPLDSRFKALSVTRAT